MKPTPKHMEPLAGQAGTSRRIIRAWNSLENP